MQDLMDSVLDEAKSATGLDDFGDDSFREGLEILLRSLRDEAQLNARGAGYLYPRLAGHLQQRLLVEDWYRRHPEIDEVPAGGTAVRPRAAAHRIDRAVLPARPGPRHQIHPQLGVRLAMSAVLDRAGLSTHASRRARSRSP